MTDREQHDLITEALAAIRFYRRHYASTGIAAERLGEVVQILRDTGEQQKSRLLMEAAEAIGRSYGSGPPPTAR